jgi:hypothetical protein
MDDATLNALKESIKKWERRATGEHNLPLGTAACPLCRLFHCDYTNGKCCEGCPVFEKTGECCCIDTPYLSYTDNRTDANAKRELEFLKSLLPAEEAQEEKAFNWVDLDYLS